MKEMVWLEKHKREYIVKGLNELAQMLDVIAAVIFGLIDFKVNLYQSNNSHAIFATISFLTVAGFLVVA